MRKINRTRSAGGVVVSRGGRVLVVSQHGTSWSLPKGRVEEGEDDLAAALREIREESGLTELELVRDLGSYERFRLGSDGAEDETEMKTIRLFLFAAEETEPRPVDPENPEARWVAPAEAAGLLTHAKDREFFAGVMTLIRQLP